MFDSDGRCLIMDWKNAKIASATLDLAFLLFSSAGSKVLAPDNLSLVLKEYHGSFCSTLRKLQPRCPEPSLSDVEADFRLSVKDSLLQAICAVVAEMEHMEAAAVSEDGEVDEEMARQVSRVYYNLSRKESVLYPIL